MQENKNLVEEALIQMKNVEEAIAENAKGILASTMKEEINQLVKESLSEQDEIEDDEVDMSDEVDDTEMDMDTDKMDDFSDEIEIDFENEPETQDLTGLPNDELFKIFKRMNPEDSITVVKDGSNLHITDDDSDVEYLVNMGESKNKRQTMKEEMEEATIDDIMATLFDEPGTEMEVDVDSMDDDTETEMEVDVDNDDMDMEDEVMYEIELGEDDDEADDEAEDDADDEADEMAESDDLEEADDLEESDDLEEADDLEESDDLEEADDLEESDDLEEADDLEESDDLEEADDLEEGNWEESIEESYSHKKAIKPKGVGIGKGPKFSYKTTAKGGFKEDKKEGPKTMGTGKAKFEYKKGANMEGKSKKVETKEGRQGYKDREDEKLGMKHGKTAMKHLKGSHSKKEKSRRDDAGFEKRETKEAARTYGMGSKEGRGLRKGITNNRNYVYSNSGVKVESLESEVSMLREKNDEYRKALNVFREKLNEVAIFNSNLAYATRLFTEHSTTKKEKINILRRFDGVETLKESKNLYKAIKDELSTEETKPITEAVETKLNKNVSSGSAVNLIESKTYENPQFLRMKDLMSKIN